MLCDGRFVCGCADPYGHRVLGDARRVVGPRRLDRAGHHRTASGSQRRRIEVLQRLSAEAAAQERTRRRRCGRSTPGPMPQRMFIECTAACNISCTDACCAPETGITRTRQTGMLDFDLFRRVIDEAGPSLGRIDFFNYGEAFLHKRAIEMCEYIKSNFPHIYLYTSTNGLAFYRGAGAPTRALRHRRGDVLDGRRHAGQLREVSAARPARASR